MVSSVLSSVLFTGLVAAQWPQNPQWGGSLQQPRGNQWPGPQQGPGWGGQYQGAPGFNGQYQGAPGFNGQYQGAPGFNGQYQGAPGFGGQPPRGQPSASSKDDEGQLGDLPTVLPDPRNDSNYTRYCQILPYDAKPNYGIQCQWGNGTVAVISQKGVNTLLNMHAVTPESRYNACNAYLPFFCKRTMTDFEANDNGQTTLTWLAVNVGMKTCWITEGNVIEEERTKCVQQLTECKPEWMANEYTDAQEPDPNKFDHTARKYPGWPGPNVPADQDNGYFGVNWKIPQRDLAARTTPASRCVYNNMGSDGRRQR